MTSFRAAALLLVLAAFCSECQSAQSDRSRHRSGPIRSVPVGADVKRDVNFDCPEEFGYYPHPSDCSQYYVCVFGGALLESCTGGLMYSHELQTCDWPRNVGCDAMGSIDNDEIERVVEHLVERKPKPPPPPPPRRAPLPPPQPQRVQPNPVVTSRGQPKLTRDEYEKQQQLYAEVDDLPPVEEIENDRQQRVYRGQPSTIGQVQRDRDGYAQVDSGRTLNTNVIQASVPQNNGKIGSFSFGTQIEERRPIATQAPQAFSEGISNNLTDTHHDRQSDIDTNVIDENSLKQGLSRRKRDTTSSTQPLLEKHTNASSNSIKDRNDGGMEDYDLETETEFDLDEAENDDGEDGERGKRQIRHGRYYFKNGFKSPGKNWASPKPIKLVDIPQYFNTPSNTQNIRFQPTYNSLSSNNLYDGTRKPGFEEGFSTANPFLSYQTDSAQSQRPFKASQPDNSSQKQNYNPLNTATQIITKSPPISSLSIKENPFAALAGGFYNNNPKQDYYGANQNIAQSSNNRPINSFYDSFQLPSTVVTGSPVIIQHPRPKNNYRLNQDPTKVNAESQNGQSQIRNTHFNQNSKGKTPTAENHNNQSDEEENESSEENSSEDNDEDDHFKYDFPEPPYEYTHPSNKYADIKNPFADPNFDFDAFIAKLSSDHDVALSITTPRQKNHQNSALKTNKNPPEVTTVSPVKTGQKPSKPNYHGMSTPRPFSIPTEGAIQWPDQTANIQPTSQAIKFEQFIQRPQQTQEQSFRQHHQQQLQVQQQQHQHQEQHQKNLQQQQQQHKQQQQQQQQQKHQQQQQQQKQQQQQQQQNQQQQQQQQNQQQQTLQQYQPSVLNENIYNRPLQNSGIPLDALRPKLKPPNFKDDRQLPINYNFNHAQPSTIRPVTDHYNVFKGDNRHIFSVTQKPYVIVTGTGSPILVSTPKHQYLVKPEKIQTLLPHLGVTGKPYSVSSVKPYLAYKSSTPRPLSTIANEQLTALQQFWKHAEMTARPTAVSELPNLESLFSSVVKSTPHTDGSIANHNIHHISKDPVTSTTNAPPSSRKPIPKPSPEMPDYYYDDDEQYYFEPPVKSQYMPSSEIRPQRPKMAQNYQEYEDSDSYEDESEEKTPQRRPMRRPVNYNSYETDTATKNHNDISVATKVPHKEQIRNMNNGKPNLPVVVKFVTPSPNVLTRPEVANYAIHHGRNRTIHMRRPSELGPNTNRPPKYLNQTTLRPYTVRHRLAKPTTVQVSSTQPPQSQDSKTPRAKTRHPNIVTQTRHTTPRDSHNQETRYTKTRHDDRTNSLEPTESVTPPQYASPRPKMLYNGSQSYNPEQYDPYYAVYDEDGELYKDPDYVQQYNLASLRPAVQQTYRGTPPPPVRRPAETFTARPVSPNDYDDALIQGQINNQNQYQSAIRQSTRGEGNELGFEINPSSARTTLYEPTSISTTPSTTSSTSTTTTQRPTVAPITEAMTPSRFTIRSSTDETPAQNPTENPPSTRPLHNNLAPTSIPSTSQTVVNFSSLAKPFEKTYNLDRLKETVSSTERQQTLQTGSRVSNNNQVATVKSNFNGDQKKVVSLTTGFSIRRNQNNTNNPYTLTVITKPFDTFQRPVSRNKNQKDKKVDSKRYYYDNDNVGAEESAEFNDRTYEIGPSSDRSLRRTDSSPEIISEEEKPIYVRPTIKIMVLEPTSTAPTTTASKYFLKTVIKRPVPFSFNNDQHSGSPENAIDTDALIEKALQNSRINHSTPPTTSYNRDEPVDWDQKDDSWKEPIVEPYKTLSNLKNSYSSNDNLILDTTPSTTTTQYTSVKPKEPVGISEAETPSSSASRPSFYSYRLLDDVGPVTTTEIFTDKAKTLLKAFINNFASNPKSRPTAIRSTTEPERVVNIGFHKKQLKVTDGKPYRNTYNYAPRLQIITEPSGSKYGYTTTDKINYSFYRESDPQSILGFSSSTASTTPAVVDTETTPSMMESTTNTQSYRIPSRGAQDTRYNSDVNDHSENENSQKFHKILNEQSSEESEAASNDNNEDNELTKLTRFNFEATKQTTENERNRQINRFTSTTTSTTRATTTVRYVEPTSSTKSLPFPTRASRVNPAIKLAAANQGGGRRSYQSSSKCSSDNSLQDPKCNEIKYQRPSNTRGRGSAHYSTLSGNDVPQPPQQTSNRGTPPTRSRPTLKPSTAIVSKTAQEFVDVYNYPPSRPSAVYPQPTPDKTAAKCRKDVCLLPDCSCGGKDIPGNLPVDVVPQMVLITFDDAVNDLNKMYYEELFERGRVNPNGCPITATYYVSHEWTDYSQVQNLYAAGHEFASHTVSHSFGEQFSQKKWNREVGGQREILAAYGGVKLEDVRGMRAPFLSVGGNKMFKMLYDSNFTYDSSMPVYENRPPSWPYTLDYKLFHDCMIPPCPTKSYPGVWEVPMVMWQDLNGGRCSMGDACANPPNAEGVYKMLLKNFDRHYTTNRAPFGLFYHAAWFTHPHHKEGFIMFLDFINSMNDVWLVTNWQALQWVRDPTPINRLANFQPFQCDYQDRPKKCNSPKVCNLWHKSGVRYMRTCQPCPEIYPWTGKTGIRSSRIDNDIEE